MNLEEKGLSDVIVLRAPALPAQSIPGGRLRKGGEAPLRVSDVLPFDDREVARAILAELHGEKTT